MPACSASDRNLATGELSDGTVPPSAGGSTRIHTRPLAPQSLAWSVRSSSWLRVLSAPPSTRMPLTAAAWNALNSVAEKIEVRSTSSMPKRTSGLSVPKRSSASCQVICGNIDRVAGHGRPGRSPVAASVAAATASEMKASTSAWLTKLASASSCMNSNCRSARRSSSRRQRAIW